MVKAASIKQQSYFLPLKGIKAVAVGLLVFCKTKKHPKLSHFTQCHQNKYLIGHNAVQLSQ